MNRFNQRNGRKSFARNRFFRHTPYSGNIFAVLGIRNVAVAGQLIAFLALLPTALPVALPGDHRVTATFASDAPAGDHQVDGGDAVLHSFAVVLDATSVQQK